MIPDLDNAVLTKIEGGGTSEDWDSPAGADTTRWTGTASAYLDEKILTQVNGNALDEVKQTRLVVPLTQGKMVYRGDTITYTQGSDTFVRTVRDIAHFETAIPKTDLLFRDV